MEEGIWKLSELYTQFFWESKTVLKNSVEYEECVILMVFGGNKANVQRNDDCCYQIAEVISQLIGRK